MSDFKDAIIICLIQAVIYTAAFVAIISYWKWIL